jgi:hypothetical protein
MSKTGAAVRPAGAHRARAGSAPRLLPVKSAKAAPPVARIRTSMPPAIKTRFSLVHFLFNLSSFRADTLRVHEDSAEKLRETLR